MNNRRGFVYIFVLSSILALSLICVQTMELFSLELRAAAHKRQTIERLYLLESGFAQGKAFVLKHSSAQPDFEKTFSPDPALKITVTDESAKLSPFFLQGEDNDKHKACAEIFTSLTQSEETTKKLTGLAQTHRALNSGDNNPDMPVLFPQTLYGLTGQGRTAQSSERFLTPLRTRGININTAPRPVLDAMFKDRTATDTIIKTRNRQKINNKEELKEILSLKELPETGGAEITFDSRFYAVRVRTRTETGDVQEAQLYIELVRETEEGRVLIKELLCEEIKTD